MKAECDRYIDGNPNNPFIRKRYWRVFFSWRILSLYSGLHCCILLNMIVSYVYNYTCLYSSLHTCILLLHNMRCWSSVILHPSVHPPHPFSSCWRGHNITFFLDKTKQFLYVFVDWVNTSFSMETTIVIWFLDMVTVTVLRKNNKINGSFIDNIMVLRK